MIHLPQQRQGFQSPDRQYLQRCMLLLQNTFRPQSAVCPLHTPPRAPAPVAPRNNLPPAIPAPITQSAAPVPAHPAPPPPESKSSRFPQNGVILSAVEGPYLAGEWRTCKVVEVCRLIAHSLCPILRLAAFGDFGCGLPLLHTTTRKPRVLETRIRSRPRNASTSAIRPLTSAIVPMHFLLSSHSQAV